MRFKFLIKLFFLVTTVAIITDKLLFSYFYGNYPQENNFLHEDNAVYQSKLSLKKWSQTDKDSPRKVVIKVHILFLIVMTKKASTGSNSIKRFKSHFSGYLIKFAIYLSEFYLFLRVPSFFKSP